MLHLSCSSSGLLVFFFSPLFIRLSSRLLQLFLPHSQTVRYSLSHLCLSLRPCPPFMLFEELLLKWCCVLCLELRCLSHPSNNQDHPLFFFSLLPFLVLRAHPCIASSQSECRVCQRILDTRVVESGP